MNWIIYTLKNPRTNEARYVGWTSKSANRRMNLHIQNAVCGPPTSHRAKWILSLLSAGIRPVMEIVESGVGDGWAEAERRWIALFRNKGARLVNGTDGGEGTLGHIPTAEHRERLSQAAKGKKLSPEHVAKWHAAALAARIGKPLSPEHRAKISNAGRGRTMSPENKAKLSVRSKGKAASLEARIKMSMARRVRVTSPETRAKMSLSRRGTCWSAKRRAAYELRRALVTTVYIQHTAKPQGGR